MTLRAALRCRHLAALISLPMFLFAVPVRAADLPADCSQATIPDQPAKGELAGKAFKPDSVTFSTINHPQIGGALYDSFDLYLRGKDEKGEGLLLEISTIVPADAVPDGQTFTLLPTNDAAKQPTIGPGAAGIQGWQLEADASGLNVDNSTEIASIRIEFGKRANDTLTGKLYFCAPGVQGSFMAGSFKIDVSSQ